MDTKLIADIEITPLKIIQHPLGDILHALKVSENSFKSFGEAYFSTVKKGKVKGWKKHSRMTLNIIVPVGAIRFVIRDGREDSPTYGKFNEFILSKEDYRRLTVPPGIWMAFQGVNEGENLLLNLASIEHDPMESENEDIKNFEYSWNSVL